MPNEKVSYTPGPWRIAPYYRQDVICDSGEICTSRKHFEEGYANARLIAAAPEQHSWMWTALTALRYWRDSETNKDKYTELCKLISDGEDIYHKAEGR